MILKRITTRNIQNHKEIVIELPPTGLIIFTGDNSNGKSVIVKTTKAIIQNDIRRPKKRASLINRNATFGEIEYVRDDDVKLTAHICRESATTYIKYEEPGEEPIVRYLADKSYVDLIRRFGWHYADNAGITLNVAEAEEALLFYKTSAKNNGEIIQTATTDPAADTIIESLENVLRDSRRIKESSADIVASTREALNNLQIFNTMELEAVKKQLNKCLVALNAVKWPVIPEIHPVPKLYLPNIQDVVIPEIKLPKLYYIDCEVPDILPLAAELDSLRKHTCPTCGRSLFDSDCTDFMHI